MHGLCIGAGEPGSTLCYSGGGRAAGAWLIKMLRQRRLAIESFDEATLLGGPKIERGDEGGEQTDIADADFRPAQAVLRRLDIKNRKKRAPRLCGGPLASRTLRFDGAFLGWPLWAGRSCQA